MQNVNLMEKNVIQINGEITITVSVNNVMHVEPSSMQL